MVPTESYWFEPLFAALRLMFADTDVCVGLIVTTLVIGVIWQTVTWNRYRLEFRVMQTRGNFGRFLARPEPQTGFRFVAPLLTALGVLGTFGGFTASLAHFGHTDNSQQIMTLARELVGGMKTAFYTSLVGLSAAAVFNLYQSTLTVSVRKWRRLANEGWQRQHREEELQAQQRQLEPMTRTATEITQLNGHMVSALTLQEMLQRALLDMQKLLRPAVNTMGEALDVLRPLPGAVEDLRVIHGQSMTLLTAAASDLKTFSENIREPFQTFRHTVDDFDGKVNAALQQFAVEFNRALSTRQAEEKALMEEYRETFTTLQNSAAAVMDNARRKLTASLAGLDLHLDSLRQAAETDLERVRRTFETMLDKQKTQFVEALDLRQQQEATIYADYRESFAQVQNGAVATLDTARQGLATSLGGLDAQLASLRVAAADEVARIREDFRDNLGEFFDEQHARLEDSLGRQREGLQATVDDFRAAFEVEAARRDVMHADWEASFNRLVEAKQTVGELFEQVNIEEAQAVLAQLARRDATVGDQVAKEAQALREIRASLQTVSTQLEEVGILLPKSAEHYFSAASRGTEGFFKQLDGTAERIVGRIDGVVRELTTAINAVQTLSETSQAISATQQRRLLAKLAEGADT